MTFQPDSKIIENWGRLQVIVGGTDLTFYRGVITQVGEMTFREPFSDASLTLTFPGITSFESLDDLPFGEYDDVEINQVDEDGNFVKNIFEGLYISHDDSLTESDNGLTIDVIGALYQADHMLKAPIFNDYTFDIGNAIAEELNHRIDFYGLRLKKLSPRTFTNIGSRSRGSWNSLLTGWIQDLLSNAWTHAFMLEGEEAIALAWPHGADPEGYWIAGTYGSILSFGDDFPNYGSWSHLILFLALLNDNGKLFLSDMAARPNGDGFWTLSREGQIEAYGNAPDIGDWVDPNPSADRTWAIESTSTGEGAWVIDDRGYVTALGDATHYGHLPSLPDVRGFADAVIDIAPMPNDDGYFLLTRCGKIHAYGSAVSLGDFTMKNAFFIALARSSTGLGYYALDTRGRVLVKGDAVAYDAFERQSIWCMDIQVTPDDTGYMVLRGDGWILHTGTAPDPRQWGSAFYSIYGGSGANVYQWTLLKNPGRELEFKVKDVWTNHWNVTVGTPGITHDLSRDYTASPNVIFGEGIDPEGCRWRNTRYPNMEINDPPLWPGYSFTINDNQTSDPVRVWQQAMHDRGWGQLAVDGVFSWSDFRTCQEFQAKAGLEVTGVVDAATWNATFDLGANSSDLDAAYFAPLAHDFRVEPFVYAANGAITGRNPFHDPGIIRIEHYENFGESTPKNEATISAQSQVYYNSEPGYLGTMVLKSDPEEGSRFDIREGQNITYKGYRGEDVRFHIAEVSKNFTDLTVTLTIDTEARDAATIHSLYVRDRTTNDPGRSSTRHNSSSRTTPDDHTVWDCIAEGSLIETERGPVRIENVVVGDMVASWDSGSLALKRVEKVGFKGEREVFAVKTGRRTVLATGNHEILTESGNWVAVNDLSPGDRIVTSSLLNRNENPGTDLTELEAWTLGVLVGDGSFGQRGAIEVCVFGDLRDRVIAAFSDLWGLNPHQINDKHGVHFYSVELWEKFNGFGLCCKSSDRTVPDMLWKSPDNVKAAFLDGYEAADAHIDKRGHVKYAASSEHLIKQLRHMNMQLGRPVSNLHEEKRKAGLSIKGKTVHSALPLHRFSVMNGVGDSHITELDDGFHAAPIRSIVSVGFMPTYDIQVEGTHNFIADGVVVHNCENGSGRIPLHTVEGGVWQVHRIPAGEFGQIVQTIFITNPATRFTVGIFDRPVTQAEMQSRGSPLATEDGFWDNPYWETQGLVIAWGDADNMAGYYPGNQPSDPDSEDPDTSYLQEGLTGWMIDRASWNYWTTHRPWIWVAEWVENRTNVVGRLYPGLEGPGLVPDVFALPEIEEENPEV